MTKIIVQLYVENLLKVLKVLKTRTALKRNGLVELRIRYARQSAKALSKQGSKTSQHKDEKHSLAKKSIMWYNTIRGRETSKKKGNETK